VVLQPFADVVNAYVTLIGNALLLVSASLIAGPPLFEAPPLMFATAARVQLKADPAVALDGV
jgi:hypothetical protein